MPPRRRSAPGPQIKWERLPLARELPEARAWLEQAAAGLAGGTVGAYSRAVERFLAYCRQRRITPRQATTDHLLAYLRELEAAGLGRAARAQRLTAVRLFYAFVVERGLRPDNPVAGGIGLPPPGGAATADGTGAAEDGPALPWVPEEAAWLRVLAAAGEADGRTRLMLALAYEGALGREELCALRVSDVDPDRRTVRVAAAARQARAESLAVTTAPPGHAAGGARVIPLSPLVAERCAAYLREERRNGGALFVSASPRNRAEPLAGWTWSKVVRALARRAGTEGFTTRTPRHLRLTDLARAGASAAAIARFAGQRRPGQAQRYLRLARERPDPQGAAVTGRRTEQLAAVLFRRRR